MSDVYSTLEEATAALASTAERAAILIRTESSRAREEAGRTRRELDELKAEVRSAKAEFETVRMSLMKQDNDKERIRRSAGWAWSAVGLMAACVIVAVGWTAMQLTRGHAIISGMSNDMGDLKQSLQNRESELAALRTQLESARVAQACAEMEAKMLINDRVRALEPVSLPITLPDLKPAAEPITSIIDESEDEEEFP